MWFGCFYRQKWIIWDSFIILILWNWLAIASKRNTGFWCMNSCLEAAWKIICSEVLLITSLDTLKQKLFHFRLQLKNLYSLYQGVLIFSLFLGTYAWRLLLVLQRGLLFFTVQKRKSYIVTLRLPISFLIQYVTHKYGHFLNIVLHCFGWWVKDFFSFSYPCNEFFYLISELQCKTLWFWLGQGWANRW